MTEKSDILLATASTIQENNDLVKHSKYFKDLMGSFEGDQKTY